MARFRHLPIWKDAMDLALHLEHAVRRFPRYHKYTLGSELRQAAQRQCRLVARVNDAQGVDRLHALDQLVHAVEEGFGAPRRGHCRATAGRSSFIFVNPPR